MRSAAKTYLRILYALCAGFGIICLLALQFGWLVHIDNEETSTGKATWGEISSNSRTDFLSAFIPVNTSDTYHLTAEIRCMAPDAFSNDRPSIYFGVVTYDSAKKEIVTSSGASRYPSAWGKVIPCDGAWNPIYGKISGEDNDDSMQNRFRVGTHFVRIIAALNVPRKAPSTNVVMGLRNPAFYPELDLKKWY